MKYFILFTLFCCTNGLFSQSPTYASLLGYKPTDKVIILHVDDVGMSYESTRGGIDAIEKGVANSWSIMMPCPWVPQAFHYLKDHPLTDAGLHLTLTSEWKDYRWHPLAGAKVVKGLIDSEGAMHHSVKEVIAHANPDEVFQEIKAQLDRSLAMGWTPTHFDSHMGTLMADPAFLQKYVQLGIESKIPIMLPVGHNTMVKVSENISASQQQLLESIGKHLWANGLPVIDDLHNLSYGWKIPEGMTSPKKLRNYKSKLYIDSFKKLQPGITFVITHCTAMSEIFPHISDSGLLRLSDLEAMKDPALKKYLEQEGIILTTWRELIERRRKIN